MPDATATDPLDAELRRIARALVAEAPDAPAGPDVLRSAGSDASVVPLLRAPERPPRRRRSLVAAAAAAVVLMVAGALAVTGDGASDHGEGVLAANAGLEPAPQRLFVGGELVPGGDRTWRELLPAGEPVPLELAGLDPSGQPLPLPGGGHVVVGVHTVPAPPPEGFNEFTDLTYALLLVGPNGKVAVERNIEHSSLVAVTETEAILARQATDDQGHPAGPVTILAHDLATGDERTIHRDAAFDPARLVSDVWAVVAGNLVRVEASQLTEPLDGGMERYVPGSEECTLRVLDLATGENVERPIDLDCTMMVGLRASPDGSRASLAYEGPFVDRWPQVRLAVLDLATGTVVHDQLLAHNLDCRLGCPSLPGRAADYVGMAWDDASTLRVALADLTSDQHDLIVETITVG
jgi:hypothetical protein